MRIDIYARWKGQSADEIEKQEEAWASIEAGGVGYLREAYHGEPYATRYLCAEAFVSAAGARIDARLLRDFELPTFFGIEGIADVDVGEAGESSPHDDVAGWRIIRPTEIATEAGNPVEVM